MLYFDHLHLDPVHPKEPVLHCVPMDEPVGVDFFERVLRTRPNLQE